MASCNRSPSEYFIKFLISKQEYDENTIVAVLEDHQLYAIGISYIRKLKAQMEPFPTPWDPTGSKGPTAALSTKEYLRKEKIYDIWYSTEPVQEAYRILGEPKIREGVEQLLLSPLKVEDVARRLSAHFGVTLTPEGLSTFAHYFWNKSLLTMEEWVDLMDGKPSAYERITTLRVSPDVADMVVPWLAGISGPPPSINTGSVARRLRDVAFLKILEIERKPADIAHSKMMKNYSDVISSAEEQMRQSDVALKEVLNAFEKFRLKKDDKDIPSIDEVAGTNYSAAQAVAAEDMDRLLEE
jgi:hypothetical protein